MTKQPTPCITLDIDQHTKLIPVNNSHVDELFSVVQRSRESLGKWLPWVEYIQTLADFLQLMSYYQIKNQNNSALTMAIQHQSKLAGIIGFNAINWQQQSSTIGYWLGEAFRGKGIMISACDRFMRHGFEVLGLHKIMILCAAENKASQKIPKALALKKEGYMREAEWLNQSYVDLIVYSMLCDEYHHSSSTKS